MSRPATTLPLLAAAACLGCGGSARPAPPPRPTLPATAPPVCRDLLAAGRPARLPPCPAGTRRVSGSNGPPARYHPELPTRVARVAWCVEGAGREHGPYRELYGDGSVARTGQFDHGRYVGTWTRWSYEGLPLQVEQYGPDEHSTVSSCGDLAHEPEPVAAPGGRR